MAAVAGRRLSEGLGLTGRVPWWRCRPVACLVTWRPARADFGSSWGVKLRASVPCSNCGVARATNNFEVVVPTKLFRHLALSDKEALAIVAPCLQVPWFGAVLDETQDCACRLHVVTTDDGVGGFVMSAASSNCAGCHVWVKGRRRSFREA